MEDTVGDRLLKVLGRAVDSGLIPGWMTGYRLTRSISSEAAALASGNEKRVIEPPVSLETPSLLPMPYVTEDHFEAPCSYLTTLDNVRIVCTRDQWGNQHYGVFDSQGRFIREEGFDYYPQQAIDLNERGRGCLTINELCWTMRRWPKNHSHWILEDLPSILLALEHGFRQSIMVPSAYNQTRFNQFCLGRLCLAKNRSADMIDPVIRVERLTLVRASRFHPRSLSLTRSLLVNQPKVGVLKCYISRQGALYRRIANEEEIRTGLEKRGFETLYLEDLDPSEQIEKIASSRCVAGLHGAGMANISLCPRGANVIEILDGDRGGGNQDVFRRIAGVCELRYWPVGGTPSDLRKIRGHCDVRVDPAHFFEVVDMVN